MTDKKFISECKSQYSIICNVDIDDIFEIWFCKTEIS